MVAVHWKIPLSATLLFLLFFILTAIITCSGPTATDKWDVVDRVIDGDTLILEGGRRVRLMGLDAPEMDFGGGTHECYAPEATAFLNELVGTAGGRLRLELDEVEFDIYGRTLAYLWDRQGRMLNEEILREGYAVYMPDSDAVRWRERLRLAGEEAMLAQRGLWHPDACPSH